VVAIKDAYYILGFIYVGVGDLIPLMGYTKVEEGDYGVSYSYILVAFIAFVL